MLEINIYVDGVRIVRPRWLAALAITPIVLVALALTLLLTPPLDAMTPRLLATATLVNMMIGAFGYIACWATWLYVRYPPSGYPPSGYR